MKTSELGLSCRGAEPVRAGPRRSALAASLAFLCSTELALNALSALGLAASRRSSCLTGCPMVSCCLGLAPFLVLSHPWSQTLSFPPLPAPWAAVSPQVLLAGSVRQFSLVQDLVAEQYVFLVPSSEMAVVPPVSVGPGNSPREPRQAGGSFTAV